MTMIYALTLAAALIALVVWVINFFTARHPNARLYTIAPVVWMVNFVVYHGAALCQVVPTEIAEPWVGMLRLHAILTAIIMGLMSYRGGNGPHGTD